MIKLVLDKERLIKKSKITFRILYRGKLILWHMRTVYGYSLELNSGDSLSAQYFDINMLERMVDALITYFNLTDLTEENM